MKAHPIVSVIYSCYNHSAYINKSLDALIQQDYPNLEIIITDDASSDGSLELIESFVQEKKINCKKVFNKVNKGFPATLNAALDLVTGKYLQIIAADDLMKHNKISHQVAILEQSGCDLCCSNFETIDSKGNIIQEAYFPGNYEFPVNVFQAILQGHQNLPIVVHSPTALCRTQAIREIGGYREDLLQEDFYMWLNLSLKYKFTYTPEILISYRVLESSLSNQLLSEKRKRYLEDHIKVLESLPLINNELSLFTDRAKLNRLMKLFMNEIKSDLSFKEKQEYFKHIDERSSVVKDDKLISEFRAKFYWTAYRNGLRIERKKIYKVKRLSLVKRFILCLNMPIYRKIG